MPIAECIALSLAAQSPDSAHPEIIIGQSRGGQLKTQIHFPTPVRLPVSPFMGFDGWASGMPGLASNQLVDPDADMFPLSPCAILSFVLVDEDRGIHVWNDTGSAYLRPGSSFFLGTPYFDSHAVWNIVDGVPGMAYSLRMFVHDHSGELSDSEIFTLTFTPEQPEVDGLRPAAINEADVAQFGTAVALAAGRGERIGVACDNSAPPRLLAIGPPDLLSGSRPIDLPPGVGPLRSRYVRASLTFVTEKDDAANNGFCRLREQRLIAIERIQAGGEVSCIEPWTCSRVLARDGDRLPLPHDPLGDVHSAFVTATDRPGPSRGVFRLVDLAGNYEPSAPFILAFNAIDAALPIAPTRSFVCPMRCEGQKLYDAPRKCPVCGMNLQDRLSHMDHTPRHGGTFFMAADGIHHLEGTLTPDREFRLYNYDEFTRPIDAANVRATGVATTASRPDAWPFVLERCPTGEYLSAKIDPAVPYPIRVKLRVTYPASPETSIFDFDFEAPPSGPAPAAPPTRGTSRQ